jgi:hypothetical protein
VTQEIDERVPRTEPDLLGPFRRQWASALTTYKRDGTPVGTAVNIAVEGTRAFFRTYEQSWKFKRLRRNSGVEIAPATVTGQPVAPSVRARARLLDGAEAEHAAELINLQHPVFQGLLVRLSHQLLGYTTRHFELIPLG